MTPKSPTQNRRADFSSAFSSARTTTMETTIPDRFLDGIPFSLIIPGSWPGTLALLARPLGNAGMPISPVT